MIECRPEEFVLFDSPLKEDGSVFTLEDLEKLGWWYIEKDSCILVQAKQKGNVMVGMDGKLITINNEDLTKGAILKMFSKRLLKHLGENNPLSKKYEVSILDDKENSFILYDAEEKENFYISLVRIDRDAEWKENKHLYFLIDLKNEPLLVEEYLTWLFANLEWTKFREFFGYSLVSTEDGCVKRNDPDDDFNKILSETWNEVRDSQEYKKLISNYKQSLKTPLE